MKRRTFLAAAAAPAVFRSGPGRGTRTWSEIEKILARGDVRGKVTRDELPTPALMLDLDAFESNIDKMVRYARQHNRALRPHGKTHKCPQVASALIKAGAIGTCAAKLSEAEVFAASGIKGILITTAVIGKYKIERLIKLAARHPDTIICLDNSKNASDLNDAARAAGIKLNVAIDLLLGRTGIPVREPAASLAELIPSFPNLKLAGLQAYSGASSHVVGFEARRTHSREAMAQAVETRQMIQKKGIPCPWLTGGSTGTYNIDSEIDGVTEIQPGSFIFMDLDYNRIGGQNGDVYADFQNSLTVRATVVSKPENKVAIVDAGLKAFSTDKPFVPQARDIQGVTYSWAGDEHGRLNLADASRDLNVGDRLEFIVPHCDPSVNLYDRLYCVRGESVEAVWPIAARGKSQ